MFSKGNDRIETVIGTSSRFSGEVTVKGTLRVDGRFEGNITADRLIIGGKGYIRGDVNAGEVVVGGTIEGNITESGSVEIKAKGRITGDINTQKLAIVEGGVFEGHSVMRKDQKKVLELQQQKTPNTAE